MKNPKLKDLLANYEISTEEAAQVNGGRSSLTIEEAMLMSGAHQQGSSPIARTSLTIEEAMLMSGAHQQGSSPWL